MAEQEDPQLALLRSIDTKLSAILALTLDGFVRAYDVDGAKKMSIENRLIGAGLTQNETAALLGKTRQAVGQRLKGSTTSTAKKAAKTTARRTAKKVAKKSGSR